jgi:hypothetical protein
VGGKSFCVCNCRNDWRNRVETSSGDVNDMHVLHEVIDCKSAAESSGAERRQNVTRSGDVIAN